MQGTLNYSLVISLMYPLSVQELQSSNLCNVCFLKTVIFSNTVILFEQNNKKTQKHETYLQRFQVASGSQVETTLVLKTLEILPNYIRG